MKSIWKIPVGLVLLYVVVMGGSGLAIRAMLSGETGERLRARAQRMLPVDVTISGGEFDLKRWFLFRPSLSFEDLRVGNPDGYSADPLLTAGSVAADADLRTLLDGGLEIANIEIVEPYLRVETSAEGVTNLDALLEALRREPEPAESAPEVEEDGGRPVVVRAFRITGGTIEYASAGGRAMVVKNVGVEALDFDPTVPFALRAELDLFEEEAVHLSFDGHTGPFDPQSCPADGAFVLDARPADLPQDFRVETLGDFIVSPGADSRLSLNVDLAGDLLDDFSGQGLMRFTDIRLGKAEEKQLPLRGEAPVRLTIRNALANPAWMLEMPDAELQLGAGTWKGSVELAHEGEELAGHSEGSIRGVEINEMLTALTDSADVVFGRLELERYEVRFSGTDAESIQNSLAGDGRLDLSEGKLAVFDTMKTIEQKINKVFKTDYAYAQGVTSFVRAGTDFTIADRKVTTPNLMLENESARLGGSGSFDFDMGLDYDVSSLISGPLAAALGGGKTAEGVAQLAAPLRVTGSVAEPRVFLDVKSLAKKAAVDQTKRLLRDLLTKKDPKEAAESGEGVEAPEAPPADGEIRAPRPPGQAAAPEEEKKPELPYGLGGLLDRVLGGKKEASEAEAPQAPEPE